MVQFRQDNWRQTSKVAGMRFVGKIAKESGLKKRRGRKPSGD
jgi:uncharacterized protein YihD (DUF1040 family)